MNLRRQPGTSRDRDQMRSFRVYMGLTGLWALLQLVTPADVGGYLYLVGATAALVVIWRRCLGLRGSVRLPAILTAIAGTTSLVGVVVRSLYGLSVGSEFPFPSPGDVFTLASYPVILSAILVVVHRRLGRFNLDLAIDAAVAGAAALIYQWTLILLPFVQDPSFSAFAHWVQVIYGVVGALVFMAAVMTLIAGGHRFAANRLLSATLVATFFVDNYGTYLTATGGNEELLLQIAPLIYLFGGGGLLHPSIAQLNERPTTLEAQRSLSSKRIAVMAAALIGPPAMLLAFAITESYDRLLLPAAGSLALAPLVVLRLGRLVRDRERLAATEATLRGVGERLVSAETAERVVQVISSGAEEMLDGTLLDGALVTEPDEPDRKVDGRVAEIVRAALAAVGDQDRTVTGELIELPQPAPGEVWTAGPVVVQRKLRGILALSTRRPLTEEEGNAVTTLCREAAIALRAVEHTEQQVRQRSEDRFAALIDNSSDIVAILDATRSISYVSPVVQRLLGYSATEFTGLPAIDLVHPDDRDVALRMLDDVRFGLSETSVVRLRHADGSYRWFEMVGVDLTSDPNIGGVVLNAREITDRKLAEERLTLSEARFKALVQHSTDLVIVFDRDQRVRYASPSVSTVLGAAPDEVQGRHAADVFPESDIDWPTLLQHTATTAGGQELVEFTFRNAGDQWRTVETTVTDLLSEPAVEGFVLNARDITDRKNMEQRLRYQATHDELTGLANRVHVLDDLTGMLDRNSGSTTVAAILIGIDDFKEINDSLGHAAGDELLIAVAGRITGMLGFGDIAARVGGDEFVVVLERGHGETHITDLAEQILTAIASPYVVDGRELTITASAGIVFDHDRSSSAEIMLRNADIAMYRAKTQGKRQIVVFETHMHTDSFDRLQLRADLARAVDLEQFVAHYQPVIEIATRRIVGAEALIRWQHPERGLLGPNVFIPLAEETGLIGALGEWILDRACRDLVAWREAFPAAADFTMSVNLSVQQLHDPGIVNTVEDTLVRTGLPADRLVLEVTESTLITDTERIRATMEELRRLGARLAVDDFGTGYSSLGYIQQFEFDVLKIDKSFVDALETHTNRRIITAVIELARQLEVRTIAEGIESELQANLLEDLGCAYGQGYLFSRPVPAEAFTELLADERTRSTGHARI